MYPFFRLAWQFFLHRKSPPLSVGDTHISHHICWPWDLDFMMELNNGRTLTLYDMGRMPMAHRSGLLKALRDNKWGLTVAGSSVRYRKRIRAFDRLEMRSRAIGYDARFMYLEQGFWDTRGTCCGHALYRTAVTDANGIVGTEKVANALGFTEKPVLPDWVVAWAAAEDKRPWPPMGDT